MLHIQTLQENVLFSLSKVSRVIQSKTHLPVLDNILIKAEQGKICFVASSLDMTEETRVKGKIIEEGRALVPCRQITEYITTLPPETVEIKTKDLSLEVTCKKTRASFLCVAPDEFPQPPKKEGKTTEINKEEFVKNIDAVLFSASHDEARPALTGVRFAQKEGGFEVVTTDGYRLTKTVSNMPFEKSTLLPAKAIKEVLKNCTEEKEEKIVTLSGATNGYVCFSIGDSDLYMRLIESEYPQYERIIPQKHTTKLIIDTKELRDAIRSVSVFAKDNANIIKFLIEDKTLIIKAESTQAGEGESEVLVDKEGDDTEISFNSRFLLELINNFEEDQLVFEMTGALNPGVFKSLSNPTYLHVIMPVRTG